MGKQGAERRKYLRIETPLKIRIIKGDKNLLRATTKDISPIGLRFETASDDIKVNDNVELKIELPEALSPVHANAKVVWKRKISTENGSPQDIGCEFTKIEEDNKNTFLKFFCDLMYSQVKKPGGKKKEQIN